MIFLRRLPKYLAPLLAGLLAFLATQNEFYLTGDMQDVAWNAHNAWHSGLALEGPPAFPYSFFNVHISPIFWLTSLASYLFPFDKIVWFGLVMGVIYGLYTACLERLLYEAASPRSAPFSLPLPLSPDLPLSTPLPLQEKGPRFLGLLAPLLALTAAYSAPGLSGLSLPHIEMAFPALALCFFTSALERRPRLTVLFFLLTLSVREDAGFHLFALLFLLSLAIKIKSGPNAAFSAFPLKTYAALSIGFSTLALLVQKIFFTQANNLATIYTGTPPFHHLTTALLKDRFLFLVLERPYIVLPFLVILVWSWRRKSLLLPLGYLAYLPWLTFNLLSYRPSPAQMNLYYAFPFWLALTWPPLAFRLENARLSFLPYAGLIAAAWFALTPSGLPAPYPLASNEVPSFSIRQAWLSPEPTQAFADYFKKNQSAFRNAALDMPTFSVVLESNEGIDWVGDWNKSHPKELPAMLIYYGNGFEEPIWIAPTLKAYPDLYRYFYEIKGSSIRLASTAPLETWLPDPMPFTATRP